MSTTMSATRQKLIKSILAVTDQRVYDHQRHPFCFNVKLRKLDFSFDNLISNHKESNEYPVNDPNWVAAARHVFESVDKDALYERAVEGARTYFLGYYRDKGPTDSAASLEDGTAFTGVKFSFEGRSGGWLSLNCWMGYDFLEGDHDEMLEGMKLSELRLLAKYIKHLAQYVKQPEKEVEYQATSTFLHDYEDEIEDEYKTETNIVGQHLATLGSWTLPPYTFWKARLCSEVGDKCRNVLNDAKSLCDRLDSLDETKVMNIWLLAFEHCENLVKTIPTTEAS